jgi:hemolysin activation/secretion protein
MNRQTGLCLVAIMTATLMLGLVAKAQEEQSDRGVKVRPADERRQELELAPAPQLDRTPVLPPVSFPRERELGSVDRIYVKRIVLKDLTLLTEKEVSQIIAPYQERSVAIEELYALRRQLSEAYVRHGYINSGVVIPDQDITEGTVVFQEVRGSLTRINVTGNGHLTSSYITKRISSTAKEPLRVQDLQEALEQLQQDPLIQKINASLSPGLRPGEAELSVALKRTNPFQVDIGADNQGSVGTRSDEGTLAVTYLNLIGQGDMISAEAGSSGGRTIGSFSYSFPLTARNTRIEAGFGLDNSRIIEAPFDQIDIKSEIMRSSLSLSQPWIRSANSALVTTVGIERNHSESTLLGMPFSFSPGDNDGKSDTTDVSAAIEYTVRTRAQAFALRGSFRQGLDLFHATINKEGPDGRAGAFLGQLNYARRLGSSFGGELLFRWTGQFAADPLLALEKMPIGGLYTVRGYRENMYVRDDGLAGSLEYRVPLRLGRAREDRFDFLNLRFAPFLDYGRSWDKDKSLITSAAQDIYSAGTGLLWNPIPRLRADIYWGHAFKSTGNAGNSLQDKGVHFTAHYLISF